MNNVNEIINIKIHMNYEKLSFVTEYIMFVAYISFNNQLSKKTTKIIQ